MPEVGRVVPVVGFEAEDEVGRLVVDAPDTGRFSGLGVSELTLAGEVARLSLETSGLGLSRSSLSEMMLDSIGVAGGSFSSTSTGAGATTASSFEDISVDCSRLMY